MVLQVESGGRFDVAMSTVHFEQLLQGHLSAPEIGRDVAPQMVRLGAPAAVVVSCRRSPGARNKTDGVTKFEFSDLVEI